MCDVAGQIGTTTIDSATTEDTMELYCKCLVIFDDVQLRANPITK